MTDIFSRDDNAPLTVTDQDDRDWHLVVDDYHYHMPCVKPVDVVDSEGSALAFHFTSVVEAKSFLNLISQTSFHDIVSDYIANKA